MKNLFLFLLVATLYAGCTGTTATSNSGSTDSSSMNLPYKAGYSSNFVIGSDSMIAGVLNNYKAWENGDMEGLKNTLSDSVDIHFPDGGEFRGTKDSAMKMAAMFRDSLSKVEIKMDAWIPLRAKDKNQDWVCVWYTETDTHKNGNVDSAYYEDDNMVDNNGKIAYTDSHKRVLK